MRMIDEKEIIEPRRVKNAKVELFVMEIYPIFSKSFLFNSFNFDLSMRMIDEKKIIEQNNRFEK